MSEELRIYPRETPNWTALKAEVLRLLRTRGITHCKLYVVGGYAGGLGRHKKDYDIDVAVVLTEPAPPESRGAFQDIGKFEGIPIEAHFYPGFMYKTPLECLKEFEGPFDAVCRYVEL